MAQSTLGLLLSTFGESLDLALASDPHKQVLLLIRDDEPVSELQQVMSRIIRIEGGIDLNLGNGRACS